MDLRPPIAALLCLLGSPAVASDDACTTPGPAIQLASLNTWGLPAPLSRNRRGRFGRIADYLDEGLDVVGLQEVWRSARRLLLHDLRLPSAKGDSGLALVTHLPSTQPVLTPFSTARGPDAWKSKGVLHTHVQPDEGEATWFVVTHMQAGHTPRAAATRASQVDELTGLLRTLQGPTVVMGDFNLYDDLAADADSTRQLEALGLVDVQQATGDSSPTYRHGTARLDRIYVRDDLPVQVLASQVDQSAALSDHLPVQASVAFCQR